MTFKKLSAIEWETEREPFDFHVRLEQDNYVIDVFDSATGNPDAAYLTTHTCDTWEQAEFDETRRCRCRRNRALLPRLPQSRVCETCGAKRLRGFAAYDCGLSASQAARAAFGFDGVTVV